MTCQNGKSTVTKSHLYYFELTCTAEAADDILQLFLEEYVPTPLSLLAPTPPVDDALLGLLRRNDKVLSPVTVSPQSKNLTKTKINKCTYKM